MNQVYYAVEVDENTPVVDEGVLEQIIVDIETHDRNHPTHGVGCACLDRYPTRIRQLLKGLNEKSRRNVAAVLSYVLRSS